MKNIYYQIFNRAISFFLACLLICPVNAYGVERPGSDSTLAPYIISQFLDKGGDVAPERVRAFKEANFKLYAQLLVKKIVSTRDELGLDIPLERLEEELIRQLRARLMAKKDKRALARPAIPSEEGPYSADLSDGTVLIMTHTGYRGDEHGDTNKVIKDSVQRLIDSDLFDDVIEIESTLYTSYFKHHGQVIAQAYYERDTALFPERARKKPLGMFRGQAAMDYSFRNLVGNRFVLTGGGFDHCHYNAFKQLVSEIKNGMDANTGDRAEIIIPVKCVYINTEGYDSGESWLDSSTIGFGSDFSKYTNMVREAGFDTYEVTMDNTGHANSFVLEGKEGEIALAREAKQGETPQLRVRFVYGVEDTFSILQQAREEREKTINEIHDMLEGYIHQEFRALRSGLPDESGPKSKTSTRGGNAWEIERVIDDVTAHNRLIEEHLALKPVILGATDKEETVILMREDLVSSIAGEIPPELETRYEAMKQALRSRYAEGRGLEEFDTNDNMIGRAKELLFEGKKVIILDDSSLDLLDVNSISLGTGKLNGRDFCVVASERSPVKRTKSFLFVNLHAMALMGTAMMEDEYDGMILFNEAYRIFTGRDDEDGLFRSYKTGRIPVVTLSPRIIKLVNTLTDYDNIRKLFASAA